MACTDTESLRGKDSVFTKRPENRRTSSRVGSWKDLDEQSRFLQKISLQLLGFRRKLRSKSLTFQYKMYVGAKNPNSQNRTHFGTFEFPDRSIPTMHALIHSQASPLLARTNHPNSHSKPSLCVSMTPHPPGCVHGCIGYGNGGHFETR